MGKVKKMTAAAVYSRPPRPRRKNYSDTMALVQRSTLVVVCCLLSRALAVGAFFFWVGHVFVRWYLRSAFFLYFAQLQACPGVRRPLTLFTAVCLLAVTRT